MRLYHMMKKASLDVCLLCFRSDVSGRARSDRRTNGGTSPAAESEPAGFRHGEAFRVVATQMLALVRKHGSKGVVAKRLSSRYELGARSGARVKLRLNLGQEFSELA